MASSSVNQNSLHHFRSDSLPTRANPLISEFSDHLSRLRCSEATSSSSTSLSQKLIGIQDLHDCPALDKLLLLPCTQALAQEQHEKRYNELLDGSLRLLDVCSIARDALSQSKECTRELQSTLCRRWGSKMNLVREVEKYLASRKVVKKAMQKVLKGLAMVSMLKELEAVTLMVFELLLTFISVPKLQSKSSGWFEVSKLVHPKRIACEGEETDVNEFEKVDVVKSDYSIHIQNVQNWMEQLESSIQDFEEVLESLSRRLVKTRVSLISILNH
ncbi:hypothetical protein RGQ29_018481 [Quercus rubra]|uniref:Uncharacterized protein n=1 Tax=Quercus rubra TaxID=3512 RepID=A0AAN7FNX8_QUERU|nr:hypothetical protein RGQ29_018481 [Quercus rubra]